MGTLSGALTGCSKPPCAAQDLGLSQDQADEWMDEVRRYYGSYARTMISLVAAVSGGEDWMAIASPLVYAEFGVVVYKMFIFFVMFVVFGLMNILTAVIV